MALMPGPDNIFVLTESLSKGAKKGICIAAGLNSGVLVHTLAAATGVSLVLKESVIAFTILQYAGVAYLLYLAYMTYLEEADQKEKKSVGEQGYFKLYKIGVTMNLLNPKVSLFFIAFLPQFVSEQGIAPIWQMSLMGLSFMVIGFITFSAFALLANQLRKPLQRPKFWKWIKITKIAVLLVLAVFLLIN